MCFSILEILLNRRLCLLFVLLFIMENESKSYNTSWSEGEKDT